MRRWAVGATIVVVTATVVAGASATATSARAKPPKVPVKAGSTWTMNLAGAGCESDSFAPHHGFTAVTGSSGDSGTYRRGPKKLTMTWTAGSGSGAAFTGTWKRATDTYTGTYSDAGQSGPATLVPLATGGCAVVTTAAASDSLTLGTSDTDTATVTGEGGITPTGGVHFYACPGDTDTDPCTGTAAGAVDLGSADLSGSGATATATSAAFSPTATGDYCFDAVYSGDTYYAAANDGSTTGECVSVSAATAPGPSIRIVALNKVTPHEVLSGGSGQFVVSGDLFLNTAVTHQPWSGSADGYTWDDAIDAHIDSAIYVYGTIHSNDSVVNGQPLWPLDTCFEPDILGAGNPPDPSPAWQAGDPAAQLPSQQMSCSEYGGTVNIDYDNIDPTVDQIDDPLQSLTAPPNPFDSGTDIACPGSAGTQVFSTVPAAVGGMTTLLPGEYTNPVELTGSTNFADCDGGYPGIYRFDQGLWINPGPGDTVTGSNVVLATEAPYPVGGNVPGTGTGAAFVASGAGNGAPCLPSTTMTSGPNGHGTPERETSTSVCGGTDEDGVIAYGDETFVPDTSMSGTGSNFSLMIGGAAGDQVTLTGPTSGAYGGGDGRPGIVLYQDPNTQANDGFDADAGDAATIAINGVVYNASLVDYGADAPLDYWDGVGGAIPFFAGGTLQAGYGTGWSDGPAQSAGSVTLTGTAVVDDFNTDGATDMTLIGEPYTLPGESSAVAGALARCRPAASTRAKAGTRATAGTRSQACRVRRK
jgi:hypothetical protein